MELFDISIIVLLAPQLIKATSRHWVDTLPFWQVWFWFVIFKSSNRLTHISGCEKALAIWTAALRKKISLRVTMLRQLVGLEWGAVAKTVRTISLSLVCSTAEYCTPVWSRSAHTCFIDSVLNDAFAHSHWMPAFHSNGPLTNTFRHPAS